MTLGGSKSGSHSGFTPVPQIGSVKTARVPSFARPREPESYQDVHPCLIYSQYDPQLNNINDAHSLNRPGTSVTHNSSRPSPRASSSTTIASPAHSAVEQAVSVRHLRSFLHYDFVSLFYSNLIMHNMNKTAYN
uniref:Uncharacterized protein n=1 Tax=Heterorhabditis bacteriophora TaxID=37862 RepID=A0A1I7X021_HETBA